MSRFRFEDKITETYKEAVTALQKLYTEEGNSHRAYADATSNDDLKRWSLNKRKRSSSHCCWRWLKYGRCTAKYCTADMPPGHDHTSGWIGDDGKRYIITQPYGVGFECLKDLVEWCRAHQLQCRIDARGSWHFPSQTLCIEITEDL